MCSMYTKAYAAFLTDAVAGFSCFGEVHTSFNPHTLAQGWGYACDQFIQKKESSSSLMFYHLLMYFQHLAIVYFPE